MVETRRKDGAQFPTKTVNLLLSGIKRFMKSINPNAPNILEEKNAEFSGLCSVRDNTARLM